MNFDFSDEQDAFRAEVKRYVDERWPIGEVRRLMETHAGFDRETWKSMARELGLQGIAIDEAHGGQGFGFVELGIVLEEFGRQLTGGPFWATTCLAVPAIEAAADPAQRDAWLGGIASGEIVATLAVDGAEIAATRQGDGFTLRGAARFVPYAHAADLILVPARLGEDTVLFALRADAEGVRATPLDTLDPTRKLADVSLDDAAAERVGEGSAEAALARARDVGAIGLAAEAIGASAHCLDLAVAYAKERMQFARPIGAFQAIKHKAAEVLLELELARGVAHWSWWAIDSAEVDADEAASVAKSVTGDAFMRASRECMQIHGGMGFTWEHDVHLFYKRARTADVMCGTPTAHRLRLAERLGFPASG